MAGLMLLASTPAAARPSTTKLPTTPTQIGTVIKIVNGTALVGTSCAPEFPDYDHSVSFFERPTSICVRFSQRDQAACDAPSTSDTFVPPKPSEFDSAVRTPAVVGVRTGG